MWLDCSATLWLCNSLVQKTKMIYNYMSDMHCTVWNRTSDLHDSTPPVWSSRHWLNLWNSDVKQRHRDGALAPSVCWSLFLLYRVWLNLTRIEVFNLTRVLLVKLLLYHEVWYVAQTRFVRDEAKGFLFSLSSAQSGLPFLQVHSRQCEAISCHEGLEFLAWETRTIVLHNNCR